MVRRDDASFEVRTVQDKEAKKTVTVKQRLPRLRSRLLAPALSGSGSEPGARAGAGNFEVGSSSEPGARARLPSGQKSKNFVISLKQSA
ncbi:unnamed protein product [Bursaphelenchus xylophilus]|uniref:(pine wood nematode) hypothetical protein n=1 Tax=Bursaphelenchus xylophilus TaxID=6326 RepID=A0A7I8WNN3_BURXY|nr:unnamed protein product [Bursaphelenchus xylophilus]CAG9093728.1 unnamed protein product [Bursaphelenchus xylophilus]